MKRARTRMLCVALILAFCFPGASASQGRNDTGPPANRYAPGELLVKFRQRLVLTQTSAAVRTGIASVDHLFQEQHVTAAEQLFGAAATAQGLERVYKLTLPGNADLMRAMATFMSDPNVEYAEPNYIFSIAEATPADTDRAVPTDPRFGEQWGLDNTGQSGGTADADIDAPEAWSMTTGDKRVLVAVVDTGVDYTHPELNDGRVRTDIDHDFVNNDDDAMDDNKHGTLVAGIIAGRANNGAGIAGVMWQAQILPVKVINDQGRGLLGTAARGIRYAADMGARVINLSLGGLICSKALADAINYAYFEKGVVVVAAAGNESGALLYPAKLDPVIAVAAVDRNDHVAEFSNHGSKLDISAPGVDIISTLPDGGYGTFSGTSLASPYVAGVAGLLLAQRPDLTNDQITRILQQSADDLGPAGFDPDYGYGRLNAYQALLSATPPRLPRAPRGDCSACAASTALLDAPAQEATLELLWRFEGEVLSASPRGRAYAALFFKHSPEVSLMLLRDSALRAAARATLADLTPILQALTGAGPDVVISADTVERARALVEAIDAQASPQLRQDLQATWTNIAPEQLVGMPARSAWARIEQGSAVYLPIVAR